MDPEVFPTPKSYEGKADLLGPRSCYEEGKRFGEALCKAHGDQYWVDVRIVRIFNSYGPRLRAEGFDGRVVSRFMLQSLRDEGLTVFGEGSQTRSFCYVADTVAGLFLLMQREGLGGDVFNLGSAEETRILDSAEKVKGLAGSGSRISFHQFPQGDHGRRLLEMRKVKKTIGWGPGLWKRDWTGHIDG